MCSLKGTESLSKHYEECHKDIDGQVLQFPVNHATWEPISQSFTVPDESVLDSSALGILLPPLLPSRSLLRPGSALVSNVHVKQSKRLLDLIQEGMDEWLPSQEPEMSQGQGFTPSQGIHPMTRRKKAKAKLGKVQDPVREVKKEEEEEEGVPNTVLDDLMKFDGDGDLMDMQSDTADNWNNHGGDTLFGAMGGRKASALDPGKRDVRSMMKMTSKGIIFGQQYRQLMMDLSRPQPMLTEEELCGSRIGGGNPETSRGPKSILFDVLVRKVEEMERTGVVDMSLV